MANDIRVRIIGDTSSFDRAMAKANLSTEKVGSSFTQMGKHIVGGLAAFAGVSAGINILQESVKAAENAQVAHALLAQQMKDVGLSFTANSPAIATFTDQLSKMSGFTETELTTAFTGLIRVTKNVAKAHEDLALAVDLARLKHIDLATATQVVTKAQIGMVGGLRRMGIDVHAVTTSVDALKLAHDNAAAAAKAHGESIAKITKVQLDNAKAADKAATATAALAQLHRASSGAAEAYGKTAAGAMDRFRASVDDLQIKLGTVLLPVLGKVADKAIKFIDDWHKAGTSANDFRTTIDQLLQPMKDIAAAADAVAKKVGGWHSVFKAAGQAIKDWLAPELAVIKGLQAVGGLFGGGGGHAPTGGTPTGASVGSLLTGTHGKNQGDAIAAVAKSQIGIPYQWGGPAILGAHTDCSGLAQAVLAKNGIHVGRTTYQQWTQGRAVVQPQPGDLVFFMPGPKGPQHVGIYIGNDQFIEDPHTGSSVRVSKLSTRNDYVGARTYVSVTSGGGKPPKPTTPAPPKPPTWKPTGGGAAGFTLPVAIRTAISVAALTKGSADDIKALNQAKKFIESKLGSLTGEQKVSALDALKVIDDQIQAIEDTAHKKQLSAQQAAHAKQQAALKAHMAKMLAIVTAKKSAFEAAFSNLANRALAGFDRATSEGLAKIAAQFAAPTNEEKALADFVAQRAADAAAALDKQQQADLAAAIAGGDPAQIAAAQDAIYQTSLDKLQATLQTAADQSRVARDKQQTDAINAYTDMRDLQRAQLQAWLDEQKAKLEAGTQQWGNFWDELVKKAGMAGADTSTAFWTEFAQAGAAASAGSVALSAAQAAANGSGVGMAAGAALARYGGKSSPASALAARSAGLDALYGLASGGVVMRPTVALVGESGPEAVVPLGQLGGGASYVFNFPNYVGSKAELMDVMQNAAQVFFRRNARSAFA